MTKVKRIKKRYTFFSLLIICSIVLLFNLIFSSFSKTDITKPDTLTKPDLTEKGISKFGSGTPGSTVQDLKIDPGFIIKKGSIKNQPFYWELRDHQVPSAEILKLSEDFKKVFDFKRSKKGDEYTLFFSSSNQLQKIVYKRDILTQYVAKKNNNHRFDVVKSEIVLDKQIVVKEFILKGSLFQAILTGGEGHSLAFEFTEIFSWDIDFFLFPRKGDRI